ncbi:thiamine pyrophosphate-dependent dehydrogenase E1 component subunit alpha [Candidatus Woesearchaeota archaeon]|nr:thiamine pyrophosphate-dependent dehydrogenase E1 component subunit alpha [Candidatus Woesearchaeota archaeon]
MVNSPQEALALYQKMLYIRMFEEKVTFLFTRGLIHGTAHFYIGQEAVAVGVCSALQKDDFVTSTHRGHGHALAKGLHPGRFLAELQGKKDGFCGGRAGTQHTISFTDHFLANGVTGGAAVTGTGIALAYKMQKKERVVVSFIGDGAMNEGHFHEALNLAAVWKLPIIYVCENNLYAMSTHTQETMIVQELYKRAASYGLETFGVDGNDVLAVQQQIQAIIGGVRGGNGPVFLECKTYRQSGHSKNDQRVYRTRKEEEAWKQKDPILRLAHVLRGTFHAAESELQAVQAAVAEQIEEAVHFAESSPFPMKETAQDHVFA